MKEDGHYYEMATEYEEIVSKGFETPKTESYSVNLGEGIRHYRQPVENKKEIRSMVFGGFRRCLYPMQKFDSDSERRFAVICESDPEVEKWFKPTPGQLKIYYNNSNVYHPDFVVETKTTKYICEVKKEKELQDKVVQQKAGAVIQWCQYATKHELQNGGKPWKYVLIPHTDVDENMTILGLASRYILN
ncbi:TnsA endonuclease N-terminal domain-containing protein [Aneurinibacillus tyrosinisolvens]|uniref:TnsA endonuclease N-terminal domain-containing protein n=1 Tax=Aneurinibacillus tyrosinisolvens TaxID=1443435 RepID=UPI00063FCBA5|nr:TnsA endonuclease N-terminal domain-containing protein [Aneurinibacillus tyrosinisolvens]